MTTHNTIEEIREPVQLQEFADDVRNGLRAERKFLKPKYFYDDKGSELFEEICRQAEYYPTRTETSILQTYAPDIARTYNGKPLAILELGSGSSTKTRYLLQAFMKRQKSLHYLPIDISNSILQQTAKNITCDFCNIRVTAIPADYFAGIEKASQILSSINMERKLVLFLGSSIGNFEPKEAESFLGTVGEMMNEGDNIMIGFDLHKSKSILEPAYNDKSGVTEKFNLNVLARINKELGGRFDLSSFRHRAFYNGDLHRIEMHLVSKRRQSVTIDKLNETFEFDEGETIHTENSYKYSVCQIDSLADRCGFEVNKHYLDKDRRFDLAMLSRIA